MAITEQNPLHTYTGNGVATTYGYGFLLLESADLKVQVTESGVTQMLALGVDYAILGLGDPAGGSVEFAAAPANGAAVVIYRDTALSRSTDYQANGDLLAETLDADFDRIWMALQEVLSGKGANVLRAPVGETLPTMPNAAERALKLLGFDADGNPTYNAPVSGSAADLALDLASSAVATEGAGMIGFDRELGYAAGTAGRALQGQVLSIFDALSPTQIADVIARTASVDVTSAIQSFLTALAPGTLGSVEVFFPDGTYSITGSGTRILEIPAGIKLRGASLEGTQLKVAAGSTAAYVIEDDGSAAKIEIENLTVNVNNNASATRGIRLGVRATQFGTYGRLDNIMVRGGAHASFRAYDLDVNVVVCGRLYVLNSIGDGLIADAGGSALRIDSFTPLGFTAIGMQLAAGDSVSFGEFEAPGSDNAVPLVYERGGTLWNMVLSVQAGRVVKTPVRINGTYVDDFVLGPTTLFRDSTGPSGSSRYGDSTSPALASTATGGGVTTLSDTGQNWAVDQWKGGACFITGGTGSGQWQRILSNTRHTLTLEGAWGTAPDNTSQYKLDYFIKLAAGGGFAHSESLSAYWPAFYRASVTDELRAHKLVHGIEGFTGNLPTLASAGTIAPTAPATFVSGTTTISTITAPAPIATHGGRITLIPTGLWSTNTAGNIALATTAVVSRKLDLVYDPATAKWYPSY